MSSPERLSEPSSPSYDVNIGNLSLPPALLFAGSVGQHETYLEKVATAGAPSRPGLEITTVRSRLTHGILKRGRVLHMLASDEYQTAGVQNADLVDRVTGHDRRRDWSYEDEAYRRMIRSVHESFRDETPGDSLKGRLFPHAQESIRQMHAMQLVAGDDLHAIVYAREQNKPASYVDWQAQGITFEEWSVQPKFADWQMLGLSETSGEAKTQSVMESRGITSLTVDTAHLMTFKNPLEMCKKLSQWGMISEVHLALNRKDMAALYGAAFARRSLQAKLAFMASPGAAARTLEGEIVTEVVRGWKAAGKPGTIVYEEKTAGASMHRIRATHKAIIENTHALIADVKAA